MSEWTKDALSSLIHQEYQAGNFYRFIADKIKSTKPRNIMMSIAKDEDSHQESLSLKYKEKFGDRFKIDPKKPELPEFDYDSLGYLEQPKVLEVLSFAIGAEGNFIENYEALKKHAPSEEEEKLIKSIIKSETSHKKKLQKQYKKAEKIANLWNIA